MKRYLLIFVCCLLMAAGTQAATTTTSTKSDGCKQVINTNCIDCSRRRVGEYKKMTCCTKNFTSCCTKQGGLIAKQNLKPKHTYSLSCNAKAADAGKACSADAECTYGCDLKNILSNCDWRVSNLIKGNQIKKYICRQKNPGRCRQRPDDTKLSDKSPYYYIEGSYICEMTMNK